MEKPYIIDDELYGIFLDLMLKHGTESEKVKNFLNDCKDRMTFIRRANEALDQRRRTIEFMNLFNAAYPMIYGG